MPGNTLGKIFQLTSFGESHGKAIGGIIDGCPAGLMLNTDLIHKDLQRRKPGQSHLTSSRQESEEFEILSGLFEGKTLGTPIAFIIPNKDVRSSDYTEWKDKYRPSHADYTYDQKYGIRDYRGGGRSSARETVVRVFAGAVAKQLLATAGIEILAYVTQISNITGSISENLITSERIESSLVRCPDRDLSEKMISELEDIKAKGDTTGGIIHCIVQNVPPGLGEPVFNKLQADLAAAMMSINAAHGFEYGSGFAGSSMYGSSHNDQFISGTGNSLRTKTNHSGGIQGGISNGMDIHFNVAFKPVATIQQVQETRNSAGESVKILPGGRHDPCVVPRAVPIVEAMAAIILADHYLRAKNSRL